MDLLYSFKEYIKAENLFQPKAHLLLAVSGGVDSIVLCRLCKDAGYHFSIAHCNFKLRGEESEGDEAFVKSLADEYAVAFFVKHFNTEKYAEEKKVSIQVAARELRYDWFTELISHSTNQPFNYLLTAHHADDNIETILMNFFKGSGINGLKGILPKQKNIIRPLLFAGKQDIVDYASENILSYREDSSNSSDKYSRNYFRNQLIPSLEKVFPQVKENLANNANRFREINMIYQFSMEESIKKLITVHGIETHIPVLKLLKTPALHSVIYEIIKTFNFTAGQIKEVVKLLNSESGKYIVSPTHRMLHNRKWLIISPLNSSLATYFTIEDYDETIIYPEGKLLLLKKGVPGKIEENNNNVQLDAAQITFPLLLRKWKAGDYFYPLGMAKKKKLSRFFIDQKLSLNKKEKTWVLESNKKIIWIVGQRIDNRFKITDSTKAVLNISLTSSE